MEKAFCFDPDRVAHYEAAGWRAYYDRRWLRLFSLLAALCREQFRIPFPVSLLAAYYAGRGATAWAPATNDPQLALRYYVKFFRLARRYSGLRFDPDRAAELELRYWDVHRRLVRHPDKGEFVQAMVALHGELFGLTPEQARESAEWRVQAASTVDRITGKTSTDVEGDWAKVEEYLRRCYWSIQHELAKPAESRAQSSPNPA